MLSYIKGRVLDCHLGKITIAIGDSNGMVGYLVNTPQSDHYHSIQTHHVIELFLVTQFKQDALDLYGFFTPHQKFMFQELLQVTGIGPKSALNILSHTVSEHLHEAILHQNQALLEKTPGIGKKGASRILLEMRPSLEKKNQSSSLFTARDSKLATHQLLTHESLEALLALGYDTKAAQASITQVLSELTTTPTSVQELIRLALRYLSRPTAAPPA